MIIEACNQGRADLEARPQPWPGFDSSARPTQERLGVPFPPSSHRLDRATTGGLKRSMQRLMNPVPVVNSTLLHAQSPRVNDGFPAWERTSDAAPEVQARSTQSTKLILP